MHVGFPWKLKFFLDQRPHARNTNQASDTLFDIRCVETNDQL